MTMNMGLVVYLSMLVGSFVVPFMTLQFVPGRKFLCLATYSFFAVCIWIASSLDGYGSDRMGTGHFLLQSIFFSTLAGTTLKAFRLHRAGKSGAWSWKDWAIMSILPVFLFMNMLLGTSGICLVEGRKLSEREYIDRFLDDRKDKINTGYYKIEKAKVALFGGFRVNLHSFLPTEEGFSEEHVALNACGKPAAKPLRMTYAVKSSDDAKIKEIQESYIKIE